jgi:hypothetical protein
VFDLAWRVSYYDDCVKNIKQKHRLFKGLTMARNVENTKKARQEVGLNGIADAA